jgi:beta-lactamase class A
MAESSAVKRSPAAKLMGLTISPKYLICVVVLLAACFGQTGNNSSASVPSLEKLRVLWQKLESTIHDVDDHLDGVMGVSIEDLKTGDQFFLRENEVFAQASSIKITVLANLYLQAQQGKLKLSDLYTVQSSDLVPDSDIMGGLTPGVTRITLRDLATMMVAVSDNSATNVLIDRVGMANVNTMLDSLGLTHTRLRRKMMDLEAAKQGRENISTPREMLTLLESIYRGKLLDKESTEDFFKMLSTNKDSWIPRDLPASLKIANKPGSLEGVRNDSGIVFVEGRPYVICVMTAFLTNERDGEQAISKISLATWRMFDRLSRASEYGRVVSPGNGSR